MNNFTTNTYEMKREILNFSEKIGVSIDIQTRKFERSGIMSSQKRGGSVYGKRIC